MRPTLLKYGPHRGQVAELWRPKEAPGPLPVVVLIHGGFWRQPYTKRLLHGMAKAVVAHGWVAYNIEYRRTGYLGRGGWPETFTDVGDAIDALAGVEGIDQHRIVTCGHSAGAQLALWAGSPRSTHTRSWSRRAHVEVHAAISLAGVVDLEEAVGLGVGGSAVPALMGGLPVECADRYALASPASLLPLGVPQLLIHGLDDTTVPACLSEGYVERARSLGDDVEYLPLPHAGHMDMIRVPGEALNAVLHRLDQVGTDRV